MKTKSPPQPSNSEWLTRKKLIDSMLKAAGWKVVPFVPGKPLPAQESCAIEEFPTGAGPADYALCADGQIIGIVEAKKLTLGPQNVLSQAERYSKGLDQQGLRFGEFRVPFLYSTNGEVIWYHDIRHKLNRSRQIARFHTPDALRESLNRSVDESLRQLGELKNANARLRPYQREANDAIEKAISDRKRAMLVAMATGTGKTFTLVNEIYRLMKSGTARRILFLVDRRALAAQAVRAFASFEAEQGLKFDKVYELYSQRFQKEDFGEEEKFDPKLLPKSHLEAPKPGNAFVYVSTIQRMTINLFGREAMWGDDEEIEEDAEKIDIPIHAFDLIVADECHRGYPPVARRVYCYSVFPYFLLCPFRLACVALHSRAAESNSRSNFSTSTNVRIRQYPAAAKRRDERLFAAACRTAFVLALVMVAPNPRGVAVCSQEKEPVLPLL
jgi:type I restriction enzyme R subunit